MNRYTSTSDAFIDFVWAMNHGLTEKVYPFQSEGLAKIFVQKLSSITQRRLDVKQSTNQVEVRIR